MLLNQMIERSREVTFPGGDTLLRVEQLAPDGELIGVEYRRPPRPKPAPVDPACTFVVFVTSAAARPSGPASRLG
jgi:hypothetical protein